MNIQQARKFVLKWMSIEASSFVSNDCWRENMPEPVTEEDVTRVRNQFVELAYQLERKSK